MNQYRKSDLESGSARSYRVFGDDTVTDMEDAACRDFVGPL